MDEIPPPPVPHQLPTPLPLLTLRGLGKSYRQEGPLDWGLLSFPEPRREDPS